jgi:hypothetical protein
MASVGDPALTAAFTAVLRRQELITLIVAVPALAWFFLRRWRSGAATAETAGPRAARAAEPAGRRVLRIGFGVLWLFDGILQTQPRMAAELPAKIVEPVAASSPHWVQQVVNWALTAWSSHPVPAADAAVWIEIGIGIWMLVAAHGTWSRLAGLAGLGWGLAVWVFGESFGGIFVPGLTWLTGAPGAALSYAVAGALIALPARAWQTARFGRLTLAGLGVFLTGMAVLQAWPGRGFWHGTSRGQPGTLASAIQDMSGVAQPHFLSAWVAGSGSFTASHGFAVNLFAVTGLAVAGAVLLSGRPSLIRPAVAGLLVLCLADWVLIQDLGVFGGLSTDPNSMIPFALLALGGYLALARIPAAASASHEPAAASSPGHAPAVAPGGPLP